MVSQNAKHCECGPQISVKLGPKNQTYTIKLEGRRVGMVIEWSHMASLLVPVTVIVIGHNVDVVKVLVEHRHIVAFINDLLAGRNSGTQQKTFRLEGCTEFFDQC